MAGVVNDAHNFYFTFKNLENYFVGKSLQQNISRLLKSELKGNWIGFDLF